MVLWSLRSPIAIQIAQTESALRRWEDHQLVSSPQRAATGGPACCSDGADDKPKSLLRRGEIDAALTRLCRGQLQTINEALPIHRLPVEILCMIFLESVCTDDVHGHPNRPALSPFTLAKVCSKWRTITLSQSGLWSFITVRGRTSPDWVDINPLLLYKAMLPQSGHAFLTLDVDLTDFAADDVLCKQVLQLVCAESSRWEHLTLAGLKRSDLRRMEAAMGELSSLRSLCLPALRPGSARRPLRVFAHAPLLREVCLDGLYGCNSTELVLPWSQLSTLWSEEASIFGLLDLVHKCVNLETLAIVPAAIEGGCEDHFVHDRLRVVHLRSHNHIGYPVLRNFSFPQLEVLTINIFSNGLLDSAFLLPFLSRSSSQLHTLELAGVRVSEEDLLSCLQHTPLLVVLSLSHIDGCNSEVSALLHGLIVHPPNAVTTAPPIPNLERLTIRAPVDEDALIRLVESRLPLIPSESGTRYRSLRSIDLGTDHLYKRVLAAAHLWSRRGLEELVCKNEDPDDRYPTVVDIGDAGS